MHFKISLSSLFFTLLLTNSFYMPILQLSTEAKTMLSNNRVILLPNEYHFVSFNTSKGQAIVGDWEETPIDFIALPFLVFIVDSMNLEIWENSDNLTKAVDRIPAEFLLYLYDPFVKIDDIPLDSKRSGSFFIKVPFADEWNLVMYVGATFAPLTFMWGVDVVENRLVDIVLFSFLGVISIGLGITFMVIYLKKRKNPEKDEIEQILEEKKKEKRKELGSLENSEDDDSI